VLEYAVGLTVLIQIMFGIVDLGRAYFLYAELDHAVNEGARFATINKSVSDITARVVARAGTSGLNTGDVAVSCFSGATTTPITCGTAVFGDRITVSASKAFVPSSGTIATVLGASFSMSATASRSYQ
jgi:Flp pilus assembly protein TadG